METSRENYQTVSFVFSGLALCYEFGVDTVDIARHVSFIISCVILLGTACIKHFIYFIYLSSLSYDRYITFQSVVPRIKAL